MIATSSPSDGANTVRLIDVDESVYGKDAVLRTCYWFTDRCYLFVTKPAPGRIQVRITLKRFKPTLTDPTGPTLDDIAGEFTNSLLDYQLRHDIEAETGKIREILLAKAFSEAGFLDDTPPGDPFDPVDDAANSQLIAMGRSAC